MELTRENALTALKRCLKDNKSINVYHGQWNKGCGRDAVLDHYYTKIGDTELESKTIGYSKADKVVRDALKEIKGVTLVEEEQFYLAGRDYWGCAITERYQAVAKVVRIAPCKSFTALNKWLTKNGIAAIGLTDLYTANVCKKRSSVSVSNRYYYAESEKYCASLLEYLRKHKTSKDTLATEMVLNDEYDGDCADRYEYETYGTRISYLHVTIKTPTGRVKAETNAYTIKSY